jgi:hypothetical protein
MHSNEKLMEVVKLQTKYQLSVAHSYALQSTHLDHMIICKKRKERTL